MSFPRNIAFMFFAFLFIVAFFFIMTAILYGLWNEVIRDAFGVGILNELTFWQAAGVTLFLMLFISPSYQNVNVNWMNSNSEWNNDLDDDFLKKWSLSNSRSNSSSRSSSNSKSKN